MAKSTFSRRLSAEQIVKLLEFCGASQIHFRKNGQEISACCPVHGETRPSFSVNVEKQLMGCFACGAKGHISKLLCLVYPEDFKTIAYSNKYLLEEFAVDFGFIDLSNKLMVPDFENLYERGVEGEDKKTKPLYEIAAFRSGKSTFGYFFERGFTKETAKKFMIGRDEDLETVTIPVFWEDGNLAGVIGRFISEDVPYNKRYHVYDFEKGGILFPLDKFYTEDGTVILVEGILDAVWMHQLGYQNTLSTLGNGFSKQQIQVLRKLGNKFIVMADDDAGGERMIENAKKRISGNIYSTEYPEGKNDPQECTKPEIEKMLAGIKIPSFHGISKI